MKISELEERIKTIKMLKGDIDLSDLALKELNAPGDFKPIPLNAHEMVEDHRWLFGQPLFASDLDKCPTPAQLTHIFAPVYGLVCFVLKEPFHLPGREPVTRFCVWGQIYRMRSTSEGGLIDYELFWWPKLAAPEFRPIT